MANSNDKVQRVARELEASAKTSPTAAGPAEEKRRGPASEQHIDAINQVFALFRLNYHNQFYAAYPGGEQLNQVKKLWLEVLREHPVEHILRAAKRTLETSDFLPTLNKMLNACFEALQDAGLPDPRSAYLEACRAGTPKSAQDWSHPAVYLAGRDSDWFFLANHSEASTWPVFREHYQGYARRAANGEMLEIPEPAALPEHSGVASDRDQALEQIDRLKDLLKE